MTTKSKKTPATAPSPEGATLANAATTAATETPVATSPAVGSPVPPKARKGGTSPNGAKAKPAKEPKATAPKPQRAKPLSCLSAAAKVLADAGKPMKAQELIEVMEAKGLWKSPGGKTPAATLYAAIVREISAKRKEARFKKTDRGTFEHTGVQEVA